VIQWPITAADLLATVPGSYGGLPEYTEEDIEQMFDDKTDCKTVAEEDDDEDNR